MGDRAVRWAAIAAALVFVAILVLFRMRNFVPFAMAGFTFVAVWLALLPGRASRDTRARPRTRRGSAAAELDEAAEEIDVLSRRAPPADQPLFERLAELLGQLRDNHMVNADHARLTEKFRKHVLGRMVRSIRDYVDLAARAGPDQAERLDEISRGLEGYVPALERIDQACLENDLTALEINVEVLNEQLNRRRM